MSVTNILLAALAVTGIPLALYSLHRFSLWLESRGLLFYRDRKPSSSAAGCFVAFQRAVEPQAQYVIQVEDERRADEDEDLPDKS